MPMTTLRLILLSCVAPLALAVPAVAQEASPPRPAISPGVLAEPAEGSARADATPAPPPGPPPVAPIPEVWAPVPRDAEGRTAYGLYVAGRAALSRGEGGTGAAYLSAVEMLTPEQPAVREQAFISALLSGDLNDAARITPDGPGVSPTIAEAGRLIAAVQTYARGDAEAALAAMLADPIAPPHAVAALFVQPWIAAEAGNWDVALAAVPGGPDPMTQLARYHRAQLLEIRRRHDEADAEYKALMAAGAAQPLFQNAYGGFLERRGRREEALAVYDAAAGGQSPEPEIVRARARAAARGRPPEAPTLRDGAASALTTAAAVAAQNRAEQFAAVYIRLAINVDPTDERRVLLGRTLVQARLPAAAREAFAEVSPADPAAYAMARLQIAATWSQEEKAEQALAEYRLAATAQPDNPLIAYLTAGELVQMERHDEALALLNGPLLNRSGQGAEVHFMRGAAYESLGRVPEAEAELWAALQTRPNEPAFLNYLGYLWVDSGSRVEEGAALIARAHAAAPDDGNIQDSLGWAQFRQGQYDTAVITLEEAVAKEPANAEINDHLGDAYWQVGRKREAGFQWNRVLTLDPDAERRAEVEQKLVQGLAAPTPVSDGAQN